MLAPFDLHALEVIARHGEDGLDPEKHPPCRHGEVAIRRVTDRGYACFSGGVYRLTCYGRAVRGSETFEPRWQEAVSIIADMQAH